MSEDLDEECHVVRRLLRDNALLHTLSLEAFVSATDVHGVLETPEHLLQAIHSICMKIATTSFVISEEDSVDLFMSGMNFAVFLNTTRDYFAAAIRSIDFSDTDELCPDPTSIYH
jgi:hypothetical protein